MKQQKNLIKHQGGGQLSALEHFIAYDAQADKIHVKPKPNYFIVTTRWATTNAMVLRNEDGSEGNNIALENGENKIENADYGFVCKVVGNNTIISFDFFKYKTSKVTDMNSMFAKCSGLTSLDLNNFNTSKVTDMSEMFYRCTNLTSLDLSNFDTSKVTNMQSMFRECFKLSSLDLSSFDTSNVTTMSYMFNNCSKLSSLDLSSFDTSNVTYMSNMFYRCTNLTSLDLSNFDTSMVTRMDYMFDGCSKLSKIKCKQAFKDWCITNKGTISLPDTMVNGKVGAVGGGSNWEIVDYQA